MSKLTPELIQDGWKPFANLVNEKVGILYQTFYYKNANDYDYSNHIDTLGDDKITFYDDGNNRENLFYRRLIPLTPDIVVLDKEDALITANAIAMLLAQSEYSKNSDFYIKHSAIIAELRKLLEDKP